MKLLKILQEQLRQTMTIIGFMVSTVYIMRHLGFNDPLPWRYELYPVYAFGLFIGLVLRKKYHDID